MIRKLVTIAVCAGLTAVACDKKSPSPKEEPKEESKTATQEAPEKDEASVKLTMAVVPSNDAASVQADADAFAKALSEATGYTIEPTVPTSYGDTIAKMRSGDVQVAYFPAWAFLRAHLKADASLLVAEEIDGKTSFPSHWYVNKKSTLDGAGKLKDARVAFGSPSSASGFLFPYAHLVEEGVISKGVKLEDTFEDLVLTSSDTEALNLLLEGKVDAAAASVNAFEALPEEKRSTLKAISEQGPVPTPVFAARADVKLDDQKKLAEALVELSSKPVYAKLFGEDRTLVKRSHGDHMMGLHEAQDRTQTEYPVK